VRHVQKNVARQVPCVLLDVIVQLECRSVQTNFWFGEFGAMKGSSGSVVDVEAVR
jgi:hypothetical protein